MLTFAQLVAVLSLNAHALYPAGGVVGPLHGPSGALASCSKLAHTISGCLAVV